MIKSVSFPDDGRGYIYEKARVPAKPDKKSDTYWRRNIRNGRTFRMDKFETDMSEYKRVLKEYKRLSGSYVLPCSTNLIGKKFQFEDKKINVIFGPNGSGKTTILKAISGQCGIKDGFTKLLDPYDLHIPYNQPFKIEYLERTLEEWSCNSCVVEWTGNPVYVDNFSETLKRGFNEIGGLVGGLIPNLESEFAYRLLSMESSSGNIAKNLANRLLYITTNRTSLKKIIEPQVKKFLGGNDKFEMCGLAQEEFFSRLPEYSTETNTTLVLDEIDKSLDIETVYKLYSSVLPKIVKETGCQIIMVSHSPIVLSDEVLNNPSYNIISVDKEYTVNTKKLLRSLKF